MDVFQKQMSHLRVRMMMSVVLFIGFFVSASTMGPFRESVSMDRLGVTFLMLTGAMLLLPRSAMPSRIPRAMSEEEKDAQMIGRSNLRRMENLALYMRLTYLALAAFALFLVPKLFFS